MSKNRYPLKSMYVSLLNSHGFTNQTTETLVDCKSRMDRTLREAGHLNLTEVITTNARLLTYLLLLEQICILSQTKFDEKFCQI